MWFWLAVLAWVAVIATVALKRTLVPAGATRAAIYLLGIPAVAYVGAVAAVVSEGIRAFLVAADRYEER